jgi:hypothetical protein
MHRNVKILLVAIMIVLVPLAAIVVWFELPFEIRYTPEIARGNKIVAGIEKYYRINGRLPDSNDFATLESIVISSVNDSDFVYEGWNPAYRAIGENDFQLSFLKGFDGPYVTYDSVEGRWMMR